jgi:hypothetical protein
MFAHRRPPPRNEVEVSHMVKSPNTVAPDEQAESDKRLAAPPMTAPEIEALADSNHLSSRLAFARAHSRWLKARGTRADPDGPEDDEFSRQADLEYEQAEKEMILTPAIQDWMVWKKIELFELVLTDEMTDGDLTNHFLMVALGAIKADLLRLGIGSARN